MSDAAERLKRVLSRPQTNPEPVTNGFEQAIGRRLESLGIAKVPGKP